MKIAMGILAGLFASLFGGNTTLPPDPIDITASFVTSDGQPLSGLDVRFVVGSEENARSLQAGAVLRTDETGTVVYTVHAPIIARSVTLDNVFVRHPSHLIEVGMELDLLGRKVLYLVALDLIEGIGPLAGMTGYVADANGNYTLPLNFDSTRHSWSIPGDESGMLLTGIGVDLRDHAMTGAPGSRWSVELTMEKQEFSLR